MTSIKECELSLGLWTNATAEAKVYSYLRIVQKFTFSLLFPVIIPFSQQRKESFPVRKVFNPIWIGVAYKASCDLQYEIWFWKIEEKMKNLQKVTTAYCSTLSSILEGSYFTCVKVHWNGFQYKKNGVNEVCTELAIQASTQSAFCVLDTVFVVYRNKYNKKHIVPN